jgi:hypothetical protein
METRTEPLSLLDLSTLMVVLSYEELELIIRCQDPDWVEDVYQRIQDDPDALNNGGRVPTA